MILQLCDLCALTLRKSVEAKAGFPDKAIHHSGMELLKPLIYRGNQNLQDVLQWVSNEKKKQLNWFTFDLSDIDLEDSNKKLP